VSAYESVCVGCPLGCPLVSDHILPTHRASAARQFPTATKTIPTCGPDHGQAGGHSIGPWPLAASQQSQLSPFRSCRIARVAPAQSYA
jgi:hypothetical protein